MSDKEETIHQAAATAFLEQSDTQMRKGMLVYCVLLLVSSGKVYSSELIHRLHAAELVVFEGTLYPLLTRLARDGLLGYEWQESVQGPPRKYYWLTELGQTVLEGMKHNYHQLHKTVVKIEETQ